MLQQCQQTRWMMKDDFNRHGKRLTGAQYDSAIVALYTGQPEMPSKAQETATRKAELNLTIDFRLGVDFPPERREQMWQAAQQVEKSRLSMAFNIIKSYILRGRGDEKHMDGSEKDADVLTQQVMKHYSKVLDREEMRQYFGPEEERVLPKNTWRDKPAP